ncbi:hypothetical protein Tco_0409733 [Tanacetum coccineum]
MQKYILKQQLEGFSVSNTEGLHKGYDRFQSLLSQLEIHGAGVSTEDANKIPKISTFCLVTSFLNYEDQTRSGQFSLMINWTKSSEEDDDYALMACNSSESDTEVTSCSNKCKESYVNLKKLYDAQREQLSDASIEIKAIKLKVLEIEDKAQKEKEDLKAKVEKWHNFSKNLSKLLNTQMSANDKFGLGFECQPRFWFLGFFAPIIEEYESDSEDETIHIKSFKGIRIVEGGCSSNDWKPRLLCDFQGLNGGPVTFGGSKVLTEVSLQRFFKYDHTCVVVRRKSNTRASVKGGRSSFIRMMRDSSDRHFFRLETWKVLWTFLSSSRSSSVYAIGPNLLRIINGPMYQGLRFPLFPNRMTPFRACKCCQICTIFSVVSWIISGPVSWTSPTSAQQESLAVSATNRVSLDPDTSCQNLGGWNTLIYGIHA